MPNHHPTEQIDMYAEENSRLREELRATQRMLRSTRTDGANVVMALDAAMQLIEALIMFLPEGQPLPPQLAGIKMRLDEAMLRLRGGKS